MLKELRYTEADLIQLIAFETAEIKRLEGSYPVFADNETNWNIHHTECRDAYWRRRMWQTRLDGGDILQTAKVY
jgi:hypothetical protein